MSPLPTDSYLEICNESMKARVILATSLLIFYRAICFAASFSDGDGNTNVGGQFNHWRFPYFFEHFRNGEAHVFVHEVYL